MGLPYNRHFTVTQFIPTIKSFLKSFFQIEGKMLAKIYKCPFVECSATLSMNIDVLWKETLRKLQKHKLARERALERYNKHNQKDSIS